MYRSFHSTVVFSTWDRSQSQHFRNLKGIITFSCILPLTALHYVVAIDRLQVSSCHCQLLIATSCRYLLPLPVAVPVPLPLAVPPPLAVPLPVVLVVALLFSGGCTFGGDDAGSSEEGVQSRKLWCCQVLSVSLGIESKPVKSDC